MSSRCRGCGAPLTWVGTPKGKYIPCDPPFIPYWKDNKGDTMIVNGNGEVIRCFLEGDPDKVTDAGRMPHWATCPEADMFRRKR